MGLSSTVASAVRKVGRAIPEGRIKDIVGSAYKKDASSWLLNFNPKGFQPVAFIPATHHTLKKRYAMGIPIAGALYGAARDVDGMKKDARLSDMQTDELSNTVNISRSPTIGSYEARRDPETQTAEELKQTKKQTPLELRTGNASGDLVFALHNLKNGGA